MPFVWIGRDNWFVWTEDDTVGPVCLCPLIGDGPPTLGGSLRLFRLVDAEPEDVRRRSACALPVCGDRAATRGCKVLYAGPGNGARGAGIDPVTNGRRTTGIDDETTGVGSRTTAVRPPFDWTFHTSSTAAPTCRSCSRRNWISSQHIASYDNCRRFSLRTALHASEPSGGTEHRPSSSA